MYNSGGLINMLLGNPKLVSNYYRVHEHTNIWLDHIVDMNNNIYNFHVIFVYGAGVCII